MDPEVIKEIGSIFNESFKTNVSPFRLGIWIFIIIVGINCLINIIAIFLTKRQEVRTTTAISKKKDELETIKKIYSELTALRYDLLNQGNDQDLFERKISELRKKIRENELIASNSLIKNVNDYLDYFSIVVIDRMKRDLRKEEEFNQKIKRNYRDI